MKAQSLLIIGGSGTLGQALVPLLLAEPHVDRIRVMARGEHRHSEMARKIPSPRIDHLVGDVRDYERVLRAMEECETVFNFAAMKQVDRAEYDSDECVKTTIQGAQNVIRAAKEQGVSRCLFTSTDKAAAPVNLYGASKMVAEKLWIQGNVGSHDTRFTAVRYGNVLASQGSVVECWRRQMEEGKKVTVTNRGHTRFFITPSNAAAFVLKAWGSMRGGEVMIPKMSACPLGHLLQALEIPRDQTEEIGDRPGEKEHEILFSKDEAAFVTDCGTYFIRWPYSHWFPVKRFGEAVKGEYSSKDAPTFTEAKLKEMIAEVSCQS